jgi:hypothetical protein
MNITGQAPCYSPQFSGFRAGGPERVYIAIKNGKRHHLPESQLPTPNGDDENVLKKLKDSLKALYRRNVWKLKCKGYL